ncbi:MAG: twin transmembrane helix small protein [Burkholderiaceae bacterium]|nr:twin transmembrane helix small protein [Burkholderiaceae bacterium]
MKLFVIIGFILIIASLAFAGVFMMKDKGRGREGRMATALTFRIGLSVALFLILLLAYRLGWIHPTGFMYGN